jgi:hypothetical protein
VLSGEIQNQTTYSISTHIQIQLYAEESKASVSWLANQSRSTHAPAPAFASALFPNPPKAFWWSNEDEDNHSNIGEI